MKNFYSSLDPHLTPQKNKLNKQLTTIITDKGHNPVLFFLVFSLLLHIVSVDDRRATTQ